MPQGSDVTLVWNSALDATQYKVELWGEAYSLTVPCDWQSGIACHVGQMQIGTLYWHVKARNSRDQESAWSHTWSFAIQASPPVSRTWTVMVYLNGDNDLGSYTDDVFNKLETAANRSNVKIVVLWDQDSSHGPGTCRYLVQYDTNPSRLGSYTEGVNRWCSSELNMGDKQTLADFVNWTRDNYSANHYFLSIFDHGGGWAPEVLALLPHARGWMAGGAGLSWDDTDEDYLSTYDLGWVFNSVGHVDVVYYDACLMAMLEDADEIKNSVDFLIASENLAYAAIPYDFYVAAITETTTPADLSKAVAGIYMQSLPSAYSGSMTVMRLDRASNVVGAVDNLAWALEEIMPDAESREAIARAYLAAQKVDYDSDLVLESGREGFVDLYHFAQQVKTEVSNSRVISAAQETIAALDGGFILTETHRAGFPYAGPNAFASLHGVSVYLPFGEELYIGPKCDSMPLDICSALEDPQCIMLRQYYTTTVPPQMPQLTFAQGTQWDEFVNGFIGAYYPCSVQARADFEPMGVLPLTRQIVIKNSQRPEVIDTYHIYLPLVLRNP